jgi:uncharacterized protein (UPF0335 family)
MDILNSADQFSMMSLGMRSLNTVHLFESKRGVLVDGGIQKLDDKMRWGARLKSEELFGNISLKKDSLMALTRAQQKRSTLGPVPTTEDSDPLDIGTKDPQTQGTAVNVAGISGERLRSFIERIERLNEEKAALAADIKEIKAEAKATGFDVKIINYLIKIRKQDKDDLDEFETLVETYKRALGMA